MTIPICQSLPIGLLNSCRPTDCHGIGPHRGLRRPPNRKGNLSAVSGASSGGDSVGAIWACAAEPRRRHTIDCVRASTSASTWAKASAPDRRRPRSPPACRQGWSGLNPDSSRSCHRSGATPPGGETSATCRLRKKIWKSKGRLASRASVQLVELRNSEQREDRIGHLNRQRTLAH
jgi:hypothetical protein